jgi:hypothetical protein
MAFQTPITIQDAVDRIKRKEYVLPAIQREFVWSAAQIVRLFDSIMRGYPIGSFLFWKVERERCQRYKFYEFLSRYHQRDARHNPDADLTGDESVTAVLDGQQRLTSLYIGLRGSYAYKTRNKRWNNNRAFPERKLYLNLAVPAEGEEVELRYDFRFLTANEAGQRDDSTYWFRVGDVLDFKNLMSVIDYLREHDLLATRYPQECLSGLFQAVTQTKLVNYYLETDQDLDKVLNVFIRVNSGGTQLSYSDLLLSIATAQWKALDARSVIHGLVDELNRPGDFGLDKDFVLKSSLVLSGLPEIGFKVKNFNRENMTLIESKWEDISRALMMAVQLTARFGYDGHTLRAKNVLIPVACYLLERGLPSGYLERREFARDREAVRKWMTRALLKTGTFGAGLDTTLRTARNTIREHHDAFPTAAMDAAFARIGRGLRFENEEIDELIDERYGRRQAFSVLALLYPGVDFNNRFHVDHIFPRSRFNKRKLRAAGVDEAKISAFQASVDKIANLQLLEGIPNQEKSDKMPHVWIAEHFTSDEQRQAWKERNYIDDLPEDITDFLEFYERRRRLMRERLAAALRSD